MIKKFLPQTLLGRSILILIVPLIILQIIITLIFYNRHWDTIIRHRTIDFVNDITLIIESFERDNSKTNQNWLLNTASNKLQLETFYYKNKKINIIKNPKQLVSLEKYITKIGLMKILLIGIMKTLCLDTPMGKN